MGKRLVTLTCQDGNVPIRPYPSPAHASGWWPVPPLQSRFLVAHRGRALKSAESAGTFV